MDNDPDKKQLLCPSAQPDEAGAHVFGVFVNTPDAGMRVGYLTEAQPASPDLLAASGQVKPTEVMRIAAPCMRSGCVHFEGANCQLASRVAAMLDPVVSGLPRCAIRPSCRWFHQEGRAACLRCPQVITELRQPSELQRAVAAPPASA